ncbi:M48 family metallopeptidase [Cutibacterium sp. WCA-380-WT-3A]|uniref:M48 family metallopeptidase n=1 Tax=Cutibacterium porci TaxID=2605781 RepID=A0A7K0J605_9ACTN|nr:M48 family metallopeptidase [Cutibacterium porci]MSS45381.1 M48 family metallopeptidase [Cutibacterium porci]
MMAVMADATVPDEIIAAHDGRPEIIIRRSARRRRTLSARMEGRSVLVMVPMSMRKAGQDPQVMELVDKVTRSHARHRRHAGDEELARRAVQLCRTYLDPQVSDTVRPTSVRWVSNQNTRWGSCTPSTGQIRLSDRMQGFPNWVVDHVLAHELCHLVEGHHNRRFHELLAGFPNAERAEGFLAGFQWAVAGSGDTAVTGSDGTVADQSS